MERRYSMVGVPELKLAVRVRGLSQDERYFDEQTSTTRVTRDFIVIRLSKPVGLENELHVANMQTQVGGIYRVAWINTQPEQGLYSIGLELVDTEGEIWEPDSIHQGVDSAGAAPTVRLECLRCSQQVLAPVPEADDASLREGFTIARPCDTCKATTGWTYAVEKPPAAEAIPAAEAPRKGQEGPAGRAAARFDSLQDQRQKGRAPIHFTIKIIRHRYGLLTFDVCKTLNVSRTGVYFASEQGYDVGEDLQVIVPYQPDGVDIPVAAKVVRQDERPGTGVKQVAIQLTHGRTDKR